MSTSASVGLRPSETPTLNLYADRKTRFVETIGTVKHEGNDPADWAWLGTVREEDDGREGGAEVAVLSVAAGTLFAADLGDDTVELSIDIAADAAVLASAAVYGWDLRATFPSGKGLFLFRGSFVVGDRYTP